MKDDNFTAHIAQNGDKQTVREHLCGTAQLSAKFGSEAGAETLAFLQGMLHDAGKLCADFDGYIKGENNFSRGEIDHSFAGAKYLCETALKAENAAVCDVASVAACSIVSHHALHDRVDEDGCDCLKKRISKKDRYDEIKSNLTSVISENELSELLQKSAAEYGVIKKKISGLSGGEIKRLCFYVGLFQRYLLSVLIDADRSDTADFMSGSAAASEYHVAPLWEKMSAAIQVKIRSFAEETDKISRRRTDISNRCAAFASHRVGICRLVVPTGGGKTLSSLRFAVEYYDHYDDFFDYEDAEDYYNDHH